MSLNATNEQGQGLPYNAGPLYPPSSPKNMTGTTSAGVHTAETTQRFVYGTRYITWDGKVYKYSLSGASCYTGRLNYFNNTIASDADGIDYDTVVNSQVVGDTEITMATGATAISLDELAGGLAVIKPTETYTDGELMFRGINGNEAAAATSNCRIFLDEPLVTAVTAATNYAFVMPSHYSDVRYGNTAGLHSFGGIAAVYVTAASYNFWLQTYGPCWLTPQSTLGVTAYNRGLWARGDGSVEGYSIGSNGGTLGSDHVTDQYVGFVMDNNTGANGATNFMLTISF